MKTLIFLSFLKLGNYFKRNNQYFYNMRMLHIFLFLSIPFFFQAQLSDSIKSKKFYIGVSFSPDLCYRTLTKNDNNLSEGAWLYAKNLEDSIDIAKIGFCSGIILGYELNRKLGIELGVMFSNKGYKTIPIMTLYDANSDPERATNIYNYKFIDIPLKLNYSLYSNKKIQSQIGFGVALNLLIQTSVHVIPEISTTSFKETTYVSNYPYNNIYVSPTLNLGFGYKISDRVNFTFEPTFRYSLSITDDNSYKGTHLWNIGLNVGVKIFF